MTAPLSLRISTIGYVFQSLRVGATLWDGQQWWPMYLYESQNTFEVQHGVETERNPYNAQCLQEAWRTKKVVQGRHAGLSDMFVPILARDRVVGILVTGPFSVSRPTSTEILERWRWVTGRQGHPGDPEFAYYLSITLATLVLDGDKLATYRRLLTALAQLMTGEGRPVALVKQMEKLHAELAPARFVDRMWDAAQSMVDDRTTWVWASPNFASHLALLGLQRAADHALVGLAYSKRAASDPVDEIVRRDAFQRACVEVARSAGDVVAGKVGDHGVMFLSALAGIKERKQHQKLEHLMDRASTLARKEHGLSLHFGSSALAGSARLSSCYQEALGAAESALSQGVRLVRVERDSRRALSPLWKLRQELMGGEERAGAMPPRFDRYVEAVAMHSGHRIDLARAHLDAGFETLAKTFVTGGTLDEKSFAEMCEALARAAAEARRVSDVFSAYRRAVADMVAAVETPVEARHDRSLQRAVEFIHRRYSEPLRAPKVAAVAGFAPKYFSFLFKRREQMTFEAYLRRVRIERARQLLGNTDLNLTRIAELSGFRSVQYFCNVFRKSSGATPMEFRKRSLLRIARRAKPRPSRQRA